MEFSFREQYTIGAQQNEEGDYVCTGKTRELIMVLVV
jgi:hypothetical protein